MELFSAFLTIIFLIILMGLFSGFEMGVISCNKIKVSHLIYKGNVRAKHVQKFLREPEKFLGVTLVGTNLLSIIATVIATDAVAKYFKGTALEVLITVLFLTPLILIFGEFLPKAVFRQHPERLTAALIYFFKLSYYLLFPFVFIATRIGVTISNLIGRGKFQKSSYITREEMRLLLREEIEPKALGREDLEMAYQVLDFKKTSVKAILVPLIDVVAAASSASISDLQDIIIKTHYSRIPIYENRLDNIIGIVQMSDLLKQDPKLTAKDLMRSAYFIPETNSIENALKDMQVNKRHMAIVVDEYGGVSGIVTLEDIIEEIIGEIEDEYDMQSDVLLVRDKDSFIVDGKLSLERFKEETGLSLSREGVETIAGFVMAIAGKIPLKGEKIYYAGIQFEILEATNKSVEKVRIKKIEV